MKKITLKFIAFLMLAMFSLQGYAQAIDDGDGDDWGFYNTASPGVWEIKLRDQVGGVDLFLTLRNDLGLMYAQDVANSPTQQWLFEAHPTVTGMLIMRSTVEVGGASIGFVQIDPSITGVATPMVVTTTPDDNLGQIQMRKIASGEPCCASNGDLPGQNQIFFRGDYAGTPWAGQTSAYRFGSTPVENDPITLDTGGDNFRFRFVAPLSNDEFDTSSIFVSNPVNNRISIKGLTAEVNSVSVYSLIGKEVLTREVNGEASLTLDASALSSGMYLVKFTGEKGSFTQKVIKQ